MGKSDRSVRVRSIRNGTQLVIEGSFTGFLQGYNVVEMDLQRLVRPVVFEVLKRMKLVPMRFPLFGIKRNRLQTLPLIQRKALKDFLVVRCRHGAPPSIKRVGLVVT